MPPRTTRHFETFSVCLTSVLPPLPCLSPQDESESRGHVCKPLDVTSMGLLTRLLSDQCVRVTCARLEGGIPELAGALENMHIVRGSGLGWIKRAGQRQTIDF